MKEENRLKKVYSQEEDGKRHKEEEDHGCERVQPRRSLLKSFPLLRSCVDPIPVKGGLGKWW